MNESQSPRVLIVEGSGAIAAMVSLALAEEGMITEIAPLLVDAMDMKRLFRPTVALIDLALPDRQGLELIEAFAREGDCGVIVMTANDGEATRIESLDTGADDFLTKPVGLRELAARVRAVHRRISRAGPRAAGAPEVLVDEPQRRLIGPGELSTPLTEAEFSVLETLLEADGAPVSRDWLGRTALRRPLGADDRSVDQLVLKLRRKLARHGVTDRAILSTRGLGYVIPDPNRFTLLTASGRAMAADPVPESERESRFVTT